MKVFRFIIPIASVLNLDMQNNACVDKTITMAVNKTKFYDELIIKTLDSIGVQILDIHSLYSVESRFAMASIAPGEFQKLVLGLKIVSPFEFTAEAKYIEKGADMYG